MCGICGTITFTGTTRIDLEAIRDMNSALGHRGPDEEGYFVEGPIGLGVRRLQIIDRDGGAQPIFNEDKSVVIVFNGEIYNFSLLRAGLASRGHRFSSCSDTEVIVHLYEEKGIECLHDLEGMFAFALWDKRKGELFLARDRLGIKPLFYTFTDNALVFASEVKAIIRAPHVQRRVSREALYHYLSYNYIPSALTLFDSIYKLPSGSYLEYSSKISAIRQYWDIPFCDEITPQTDEQYIEGFRNLLSVSTHKRMMGDVPLGVFLSGGMDSSSLVALLKERGFGHIKTFSLGFDVPQYDESPYAQRVAASCDSDHTTIPFTTPDWSSLLPKIVYSLEGHVANVTSVPLYTLAQAASESVTIALSGLGGDEILAGYDTYIADRIAPIYKRFPYPIRCLFRYALNLFPNTVPLTSLRFKSRHFIQGSEYEPDYMHYWWRQIFSEEEKAWLLRDDVYPKGLYAESSSLYMNAFSSRRGADSLTKELYADTRLWLCDSELLMNDMITMAHSLELRVPFLDHALVSYMALMPSWMKLRFLQTKYILKKAMRGRLPGQIIDRRKRGFSSPLNHWLRGDLKKIVLDTINDDTITRIGFFRKKSIHEIFKQHFDDRFDHSRKIWGLLLFFLWHEMFIEKGPD